jgi:hypothetical protein
MESTQSKMGIKILEAIAFSVKLKDLITLMTFKVVVQVIYRLQSCSEIKVAPLEQKQLEGQEEL